MRLDPKAPYKSVFQTVQPRQMSASKFTQRRRATGSASLKALFGAAGIVSLIVACSPSNSGRGTITPRQPTGFQSKIQACADKVKSSQKTVFNKGKYKVNLCQFKYDPKTSSYEKTLTPALSDISYTIQTSADDSVGKPGGRSSAGTSSALRLQMQVGLSPNEKLDKKAAKQITSGLGYDCGAPITQIFERSNFDNAQVKVKLNLNFVVEAESLNDPDAEDTDPALPETNHYLDITKGTDGADTYWMLGQLPQQPKYYPQGKQSDVADCKAQSTDKAAQKKCLWDHRHAVNLPVCVALAKRVGNILGVVNTAHETATCGAVPFAPVELKKADAATPAKVANSTQVSDFASEVDDKPVVSGAAAAKPNPEPADDNSSFSKGTGNDEDFMSKSQLNGKDLVSILSLSCPDLKDQTKK